MRRLFLPNLPVLIHRVFFSIPGKSKLIPAYLFVVIDKVF
jgi:hypothetical protein